MKFKNIINQILFYIFLVVFLGFIIFPFFWQFITSFKTSQELFSIPPKWVPSKIYTGYYINVFIKGLS